MPQTALPDPESYADRAEVQRRARLTTWLTGVLAIVLLFATLVRPLVSDVGTIFTVIGLANTAATFGFWWLFRTGRIVRRAPDVLLFLLTILALPLLLISGGPNSQFAVLLPLYPICGVMLGGRRTAIFLVVFWSLVLGAFFFVEGGRWDLTGEMYHPEKAASRTLWLILANLVGLTFGLYFDTYTGRLQRKLIEQAVSDPLTGVLNRRGLDDAMNRLLSAAARRREWLTLMVVDLDHFKRFNDSRGHAEGDAALRSVAAALIGSSRAGQDWVARIGGEEFVVLLGDTDAAKGRLVAEKLRATVRDLRLRYDPANEAVLTATIGFVSVPGDGAVARDDLFRRADAALYRGKHEGRDRIVESDTTPDRRGGTIP